MCLVAFQTEVEETLELLVIGVSMVEFYSRLNNVKPSQQCQQNGPSVHLFLTELFLWLLFVIYSVSLSKSSVIWGMGIGLALMR